MFNRRSFITQTALATGAVLLKSSFAGAMEWDGAPQRLTILHTNDVHSRIDPFPMDGSRNQGMGGVAARSRLIQDIRAKEQNVLVLDAGDIFQGTPYFNLYKGEPEIKAMSAMGYDASTIGNHDFDAGLDNLRLQLRQHASFPMIICNYDFGGTVMEDLYQPYKIFKKGGLKIGVLGVGIELAGLVPDNLAAGTKYQDPIVRANQYADELKRKNCDLIVCLSHLGYKYRDNKVSDLVLASETTNIDVIIGGHTHTFLDAPVIVKNKKGEDVVVNQVGFAGIQLGRLDFIFEKGSAKKLGNTGAIPVSKISDI
ncbi:MAG TPA: metallophosphatase [Flavisolibacter sp.]|nr:metallophosphatase [Flavisolibacter sp.]